MDRSYWSNILASSISGFKFNYYLWGYSKSVAQNVAKRQLRIVETLRQHIVQSFVNKSVRHLVCLSEFDSPWCDVYTTISKVMSSNFSRHVSKYKVSYKDIEDICLRELFLLFFLLNQFLLYFPHFFCTIALYICCSSATDHEVTNGFYWMSLQLVKCLWYYWQ